MPKILVVDDEVNIRKAVGTVLQVEGFDVDYAGDGEEALQKLRGCNYDLVLLDMFMPKLSGKATCAQMRKDPECKDIKVIFLTVALLSPDGRKELDALGMSDYITKPFDNENLITRVRKALKS